MAPRSVWIGLAGTQLCVVGFRTSTQCDRSIGPSEQGPFYEQPEAFEDRSSARPALGRIPFFLPFFRLSLVPLVCSPLSPMRRRLSGAAVSATKLDGPLVPVRTGVLGRLCGQ